MQHIRYIEHRLSKIIAVVGVEACLDPEHVGLEQSHLRFAKSSRGEHTYLCPYKAIEKAVNKLAAHGAAKAMGSMSL